MASATSQDWRLGQVLNEQPQAELVEGDIVSAVEFSDDGERLALGDRMGRVKVFERAPVKSSPRLSRSPSLSGLRRRDSLGSPGLTPGSPKAKQSFEYKPSMEFKSHDSEFDYLKSVEIEEKINCIRWLKRISSAHLMLTTNDKTIKLWRLSPYANQSVSRVESSLFPRYNHTPRAHARRVFGNGHAYHINSVSLNSDGETFISADDLRVNLWNMEVSDTSFNIIDIKPTNMEELTEVITAASCHPSHCHQFAWSNSRGSVRLSDLRASALCDNHSKVFEEQDDPARRSFFSEIISSVSDVRFSPCGRYLLSRDYMTLRLWDIHMEARPVKTVQVHDQLRSRLCDLYESDCIFDKFQCCFSPDGQQFVTGSYQNFFHVFDRNGKGSTCIEASKNPKAKKSTPKSKLGISRSSRSSKEGSQPEIVDFDLKCLQMAWHPKLPQVAVGSLNCVYLYSANPSGDVPRSY